MSDTRNYDLWERPRLITRLRQLERELKQKTHDLARATASKEKQDVPQAPSVPLTTGLSRQAQRKQMDPSKYSTRIIVLKFAYFGKGYIGLEHQPTIDLPTVEGELWKALVKACLIFPANPDVVDFDSCEYFKCGRTDRGVSAFGQVVSLRLRSNRPVPPQPADGLDEAPVEIIEGENPDQDPVLAMTEPAGAEVDREFDEVRDEIQYCKLLNRLLPEDIRILAWCPAPTPDFSARFSCRERQYKYFFTQPCFSPRPSWLEPQGVKRPIKEGWLDIDAMQEAAQKFVGLHDFRNYCKVDGTKQLTNFTRRIFEAKVEEVKDVQSALAFINQAEFTPDGIASTELQPKVYSFNVRGSAFLWHQIRHMVSVLFLVGQKLEEPSVVSDLLDIERVPRKPHYNMANEAPLVLWDCIFPKADDPQGKDALPWIYAGDESPDVKYGTFGLLGGLWSYWHGRKMEEILANQLLSRIASQGNAEQSPGRRSKLLQGQKVYEGNTQSRLTGNHLPIMKRKVSHSPAEVNDHWAQRHGFRNAEEMTSNETWREALKAAKRGKARNVDDDQS